MLITLLLRLVLLKEICYGKTVEELQKEMLFQMHFGNCEMLTQYIMDCIERLKRENAPTVYWRY